MIPVQKSFPPELLRRWRKVMRETPKENDWTPAEHNDPLQQRQTEHAQWILDQLTDPAKAARFKDCGWNIEELKAVAEKAIKPRSSFEKWKLSQQRQSWVYCFFGAMLLTLGIFVVAGGCR